MHRTVHHRYLLPLLLAFVTVAGSLATLPARASQTLDRIVALVDDDIIMESELRERVATVRVRMKEQNTPLPPEDVLAQQVLERMIIESIELQMAERAGIRVDDNRINDTLENIARQNEMTTEQFRRTVVDEGLTWRSLRDQIRRELIVGQLRQRKVGGRIQITDQDVDNFLNSEMGKTNLAPDYRLGHILIPATESDTVSAEEKALQVYKELQAGADFARLAAQYSAGEQALSGGDLGWRKAAQLPTLFADTVLDMKPGQISKPIRSASGFHIIKVMEIRGGTEQVIQQTKVRHILIKPNEIRSEEESRHLIDEIRKRILDGKDDFATLAKTYSDDPGSALQGGDLGWVNPGMMVPQFDERMNTAKPNELSEPFRSQFGWHILQVQERRNQDMSEEFRRGRARQMLQRRKFDEELDAWLREIRQSSYVEVKL